MASFNFVDGTFNLGTDTTVQIIDNDTNAPISLSGRLVTYKPDPKITTVQSTPIDNSGYVQHRTVPMGWGGTLTIDRAQGDLDSLQAEMEANWYNSGAQKYFTIVESTRNQNNQSTDVYTYLYTVLNMETSGERKAADKILVTLKWEAQQRVQISP